jgi:DNA-binding NarL/FixJ family response regulator
VAREGRIAVAIVEDNEVFREALEILLGLDPEIEVVLSVETGSEALEACPAVAPDVVLVDYRLPDLDGVETTRALRAACPSAAVVVLTAAADDRELDALRGAGALSCLTKDRSLPEIVAAVRSAAERGG